MLSILRNAVCLWILFAVSEIPACISDALGSKFNVVLPRRLKKPNGYDHRDAMFGIPPYGGSIEQTLYYAGSTMCDSGINHQLKLLSNWTSPFILLVDRGDCSFVKKVRNSQRAGASAVLIADIVCICGRETCVPESLPDDGLSYCQSNEPVMADDGSGSDISIPSFLLAKEDSDPIKNSLKRGENVRVQMSFSTQETDNRVECDLWTSLSDNITQELEGEFFLAAKALQNYVNFQPHMYIYGGENEDCHASDGEDLCFHRCTNAGRYCSSYHHGGVTGREFVTESLRRICAWSLYGSSRNGTGLPWWNYVEQFTDLCQNGKFSSSSSSSPGDQQLFSDDVCVARAMENAGMNKTKVDLCMEESGGTSEDHPNTLLEKELQDQQSAGVVLIPSLFLNQAVVPGFPTFETIFKSICAGFSKSSEPPICTECVHCPNMRTCVERKSCVSTNVGLEVDDRKGGGITVPTYLGVLGIFLLVFAFVGYVQHQRQKVFIRKQIQRMTVEYMPVSTHSNTAMSISSQSDAESTSPFYALNEQKEGTGSAFAMS